MADSNWKSEGMGTLETGKSVSQDMKQVQKCRDQILKGKWNIQKKGGMAKTTDLLERTRK